MTAAPTPVLSVRGLSKTYRLRGGVDLRAVEDVSFSVSPGESLAIVGESGSGKTTCARMIAGLEAPTSGQITVNGQVYDNGQRLRTKQRRDRARQIQMVFQDPYQSLDRRQTVNDCLHEALRLHDHTPAQARLRSAELLDLVGLSARHGQSRPKMLSGGQRQRVAIARALVTNPALLILDEAVSALDVSIQAQVLNVLMDARAATGVAFLFISHDLGVVRHIAESVIVMRNGHIVEAGHTVTVLDQPAEDYTRRLIESIPRPGWTPRRRQHPASVDRREPSTTTARENVVTDPEGQLL